MTSKLVSSSMVYEKCKLHHLPSNMVCLYDTCEGINLVCQVCTNEHFLHKEKLISFENLEILYRQDRLRHIVADVEQVKRDLVQNVTEKSSLTKFEGLMLAIKNCEKFIREKIDERIEKETNGLMTLLQQKKKDLPTFITNIFDGGKAVTMLTQIKSQMQEQEDLVRTFEKEIKTKKGRLKNWVDRGLEELGQVNYELTIMTNIFVMRRDELGKQLDNDFKIFEKPEQKKFDAEFNTSDLKGKSDEMKYELVKKITWENQRISNQLHRARMRLLKSDEKMLERNQELVMLENELHRKQVELSQKTQLLREIHEAEQKEHIREQEDLKKEKHNFQSMLVRKGLENYINPQTLNLREKGVTQNQLRMIVKELTNLTSLDLSENNIGVEELAMIFKLHKLKCLKLNFLGITKSFIYDIATNYRNNLLELHLDCNSINDECVSDICLLKNLQVLSLVDNKITDVGASRIAFKLEALTKLYLSYNQLTFKSIDDIAKNLRELKDLRLARNTIKNKGVMSISSNRKTLLELHVGGCELGKEGAVSIAKGCPLLQKLSIGNNQLQTDSIIELIMYLADLTFLEITYCDLLPDDLDKIKKVSKMNDKLNLVCQQ